MFFAVKGMEGLEDAIYANMNLSLIHILEWNALIPDKCGMLIEAKLGLFDLWNGTCVTLCLKNWCMKGELKHIISLPIIVLWYIWKARNLCCFDDKVLSPYQVSSFCLGCIKSFSQDKTIKIK